MKPDVLTFDLLALLFRYPSEGYHDAVGCCRKALRNTAPEAEALLARFAAQIQAMSVEDLEEAFTQTFDLNPVCCLEVGWHLFGENYGRGEFLVRLRQQMRQSGVEETTELPDHLTHVLPLLGRMEAAEAEQFSASLLVPALEKMRAGLEGKKNPFADLLGAVHSLIASPSATRAGRSQAPPDVLAREVAHE